VCAYLLPIRYYFDFDPRTNPVCFLSIQSRPSSIGRFFPSTIKEMTGDYLPSSSKRDLFITGIYSHLDRITNLFRGTRTGLYFIVSNRSTRNRTTFTAKNHKKWLKNRFSFQNRTTAASSRRSESNTTRVGY